MPGPFPAALTRQQSAGGTWSSQGFVQELSEDSPDLRWPGSVIVYDRMRKDGKCASVLRASSMPIRGTGWHVVDSPDIRPEVLDFVRTNLGLVEAGDSRRRRRGQGVSWDMVLRHALLALPFGHMFFEPVYTLQPPAPGSTLPPGVYAHLGKLAPILPRTIAGFDIDASGDLASISQQVFNDGKATTVTIGRDRLVPVINDREGSDWTGQSILRAAYKHWFMKDQLERLGVMIVERNGMGIPSAEHGPDGDREANMRAMGQVRAGDMSGISMPAGSNFRLVGVDGQTVDPMPQLAYHGQEIARSVLAMFLDLGHDNGARSLGDTFVDFFTIALNAVIADLEETFTEDVVRPLVELNFGPDEAYPEVAADSITPQAPLTAEAIATLVTAGVVHPDEPLEAFTRKQFGMPPSDPAEAPGGEQAPPAPVEDTIAIPVGGGSSHSAPRPAVVGRVETVDETAGRLARMRAAVARRRGR